MAKRDEPIHTPWNIAGVSKRLDTESSEELLLKRFLIASAMLTNLLKEEIIERYINK